MRRLLLSLFCSVITAVSINAQPFLRIQKFRHIIEPDGLSVMTYSLPVSSQGQTTLNYALQFEQSTVEVQNWGYTLHIYYSVDDEKDDYIPQGGRLMIRTGKNKVLSFKDCGTPYFIEYSPEYSSDNIHEIRFKVYRDESSPNYYRYRVHGKYVISEDDLKLLMTDGVKKIRIETTGKPIECEYKTGKGNKTAEVLRRLYNVLQSNIDIYHDL